MVLSAWYFFKTSSRILPDYSSLIDAALDTASLIASKSPIAVQGTKICMVYARDHTVQEGLEQMVCEIM